MTNNRADGSQHISERFRSENAMCFIEGARDGNAPRISLCGPMMVLSLYGVCLERGGGVTTAGYEADGELAGTKISDDV